jgi:ABC-2 type transport system ATP-binding protein
MTETRRPPGPAEAGPAEAGLALRGLRKAYGPTVAVAGVDLDIPSGSFYGLVGPNGAGKTTLLSMAVGLLAPDAGDAAVLGHWMWQPATTDQAKQELGVLPAGLALPGRLTGRELLTYLGLLRGMSPATVRARSDELLDVLGLADAGGTMIADYSTGMTKKIGLAAAVLHGPRVLVLDEPLEAVDPLSAMTISAVLRGFTRRGGTVVMSTHVMALVEQLCDRVAVMARGAIVRAGTLDQVAGPAGLEQAFLDAAGSGPVDRELSWFAS